MHPSCHLIDSFARLWVYEPFHFVGVESPTVTVCQFWEDPPHTVALKIMTPRSPVMSYIYRSLILAWAGNYIQPIQGWSFHIYEFIVLLFDSLYFFKVYFLLCLFLLFLFIRSIFFWLNFLLLLRFFLTFQPFFIIFLKFLLIIRLKIDITVKNNSQSC